MILFPYRVTPMCCKKISNNTHVNICNWNVKFLPDTQNVHPNRAEAPPVEQLKE